MGKSWQLWYRVNDEIFNYDGDNDHCDNDVNEDGYDDSAGDDDDDDDDDDGDGDGDDDDEDGTDVWRWQCIVGRGARPATCVSHSRLTDWDGFKPF